MHPGRYTSPNKELMLLCIVLLCRGNVYQRVLSVVITAVISTPVFANICQPTVRVPLEYSLVH